VRTRADTLREQQEADQQPSVEPRDIVDGDPQTIDIVITALCREFELSPILHRTVRAVVESIKKKRAWGAPLDVAPPVDSGGNGTRRGGMFVPLDSKLESLFDIDPDALKAPAAQELLAVCVDLAVFLMRKNLAYGNSALEPLRAISQADPAEQIRVRMDDKLSRIIRGEAAGEDAVKDFVGYWVLLEVLRRRQS
jgi:hypothetical protein